MTVIYYLLNAIGLCILIWAPMSGCAGNYSAPNKRMVNEEDIETSLLNTNMTVSGPVPDQITAPDSMSSVSNCKTGKGSISRQSSVRKFEYCQDDVIQLEQNGRLYFYDCDGVPMSFFKHFGSIRKDTKQTISIGIFSNGLAPMFIPSNDGTLACHYVDKMGDDAFCASFKYCKPFKDGLAIVSIADRDGFQRTGMISTKGEFVIEANYREISEFGPDGFIAEEPIDLHAIYGFSGTRKSDYYRSIEGDFDGGLFSVMECIDDCSNNIGRKALISSSGERLSEWFSDVSTPSEGLAAVKLNEKWGYLNKEGDISIAAKYNYVSDFEGGFASFRKNKKWKRGLLSKDGNEIAYIDFEYVGKCRENTCVVSRKGKKGGRDLFGYINSQGKVIIGAKFNFAQGFSEGLGAVEIDGKWGFLEKTGVIAISPQFDSVAPWPLDYNTKGFSGGIVIVERNGMQFAINREGKCVIGCEPNN